MSTYIDPHHPQILWSHLNPDEVDALEWWRRIVSQRINHLSAIKAAAERTKDFDSARAVNPDLTSEQRLAKAIDLFWRALCGPVGPTKPFSKRDTEGKWQILWGAELLDEIERVDFVLMNGVPPALVVDLFPELKT